MRGLTGESSQAANPTSASASSGAPKLGAGYNQFVTSLDDGYSAIYDKIAVQGTGGARARGGLSRAGQADALSG